MGLLDFFLGKSKPAQSPQQLGYERADGTEFLIDYLKNNRMGDYQAKSYGRTMLDAVQAGNIDQRTALSALEARTDPNSSFFTSQAYTDHSKIEIIDNQIIMIHFRIRIRSPNEP